MDDEEIARLERDTVSAVAPPQTLEIGGWLVPLDHGTIGRAKSAVPLSHNLGPAAIGQIEAAYRDRGLSPEFRVADVGSLAAVCAELSRRGLSLGLSSQPFLRPVRFRASLLFQRRRRGSLQSPTQLGWPCSWARALIPATEPIAWRP